VYAIEVQDAHMRYEYILGRVHEINAKRAHERLMYVENVYTD